MFYLLKAVRNTDFRELQQLQKITEMIDRDADSVIVEGYSDKVAIRQLGFKGKIFQSAERSVEDLAEDVERGAVRVAVLTAFDTHRKDQNSEIIQALQGKVDVINSLRRDFGAQLTSNGRHAVEDVLPLFESKEDKFIEEMLDEISLKNGQLKSESEL